MSLSGQPIISPKSVETDDSSNDTTVTLPSGPNTSGIPGAPVASPKPIKIPNRESSLIKTIIIILLTLLLIGASLLAFYFFTEYRSAKTDVDEQIALAVEATKKADAAALESELQEREKTPYYTFVGPSDYGRLSFEYPKTWSVYYSSTNISASGGYHVYFHPYSIGPISNSTISAFELTIRSEDYATTAKRYSNNIKKGLLSANTITINDQIVDRYDGTLPSGFQGAAVTIKIRDKVITLQTDALIYLPDFEKVLSTVKFNI